MPLEGWQAAIVRAENERLAEIARVAALKASGTEVTSTDLRFPYSPDLNARFFESAVANLMFNDVYACDRKARMPTLDWALVAPKALAKAAGNLKRYPEAFSGAEE